MKQIFADADGKMKHAVDHFHDELKRLRTGRASVSMLDGVMVDYYGSLVPLNNVATLTASGTVLPFSTSGGRSSFTLPVVTRAGPTTLRMASCISAGVARAGLTWTTDASPMPAAAPPAASRNWRREVRRFIQSRSVVKKATTSSICSALKTGLPR